MLAISEKRFEIAEVLARAMTAEQLDVKDVGEMTALDFCIEKNQVAMVKILASLGADIERPSKGVTSLMFAAGQNLVEIVELLLDLGANPLALSDGGSSALSMAIRKSDVEVARVLAPVSYKSILDREINLMERAFGSSKAVELVKILIGEELTLDARPHIMRALLRTDPAERLALVKMLLPFDDPWVRNRGDRNLLESLVRAQKECPDESEAVIAWVADAMLSMGKPDYEVLSMLCRALGMSNALGLNRSARELGMREQAIVERMALAAASKCEVVSANDKPHRQKFI